ncbi:MAG: PQQ-dependent sugar dehydrogenase [Bdellovibrio bacteriovorus]
MRHLVAAAVLLFWLPLGACSPQSGPVTPSADAPEAQGWRAETVVSGLEHPWGIAWLPDGRALVTERPGRLRLIRGGRLEPSPIAGVPEVLAHGQGGLLDVALHPHFAENRLVYLTLSEGTQEANRTALARGRLTEGRLEDVQILLRNADTKSGGQHFGSRLLWLPDRSLLMSIGDGGNPPISFQGENIRDQAQNPGTHFGKVLRLTLDGRAHPGNPFADRPGTRPEIWTLGHRNIQGLALDPGSGRVWANEHGSRGGDELNLLVGGSNYGWPVVTYSMEYWGPRISEDTSRPGIADPKWVWTPSKAPSGLAFYTGDRYPGWEGSLFSGALKFGQIRRLALDGDRVIGEEKLTIGARVRDIRQGPDGYLYVLTDEPEGRLLRILGAGG